MFTLQYCLHQYLQTMSSDSQLCFWTSEGSICVDSWSLEFQVLLQPFHVSFMFRTQKCKLPLVVPCRSERKESQKNHDNQTGHQSSEYISQFFVKDNRLGCLIFSLPYTREVMKTLCIIPPLLYCNKQNYHWMALCVSWYVLHERMLIASKVSIPQKYI